MPRSPGLSSRPSTVPATSRSATGQPIRRATRRLRLDDPAGHVRPVGVADHAHQRRRCHRFGHPEPLSLETRTEVYGRSPSSAAPPSQSFSRSSLRTPTSSASRMSRVASLRSPFRAADSRRRSGTDHAPARREPADCVRSINNPAHQATSRRPSATTATAPTGERTIDQQNASALTRPISTPSSARCQSKACRSRIVVDPGRGRQKAAKSCKPSNAAEAAFSASTSSGRATPVVRAVTGSGPTVHRQAAGRHSGGATPRIAHRTRWEPR